ncbi:hypothetical protein K2173_019964 [Erythroxylum novogranatense]|uniref:Uncharacterized protein n=1 Tax=Erythroxylum novogranatense TaxID=1862640 RepID=A0AAV8UAH2_9ROSI|nr:hypothetical protein K2173_019964 [Erythroxylum novogranatense]
MRVAHRNRSLVSSTLHFHSLSPCSLQFPRTLTLTVGRRTAGKDVRRLSMADGENVSTAAPAENGSAMDPTISTDEDEKFGFKRAEMYQSTLSGTVAPYDRHVFLCYKSPDAWLPRVEASEDDPLPKLLDSALKARKGDISNKTRLTICEACEGNEGDVLIFPEMIKCKSLKGSDVDGFVDDVLVNGNPWASGVQEALTGSYVFVCAHTSRDKRCGVCGPVLIDRLKEGIESRGLKDQLFVKACSHVGGHKYAGNLIIFSPDSLGKTVGHWYGYVTPDDVPEILDQHIGEGKIIERLWRGQMGVAAEEDKRTGEQPVPNAEISSKSDKYEERNTEVNKDNKGACCQGVTGFSCCKDESLEVRKEKKLNEKTEVCGKKGLGKLSSWIGSLEQGDVLAACAVVGAVGTVAVAYSLYKRSG